MVQSIQKYFSLKASGILTQNYTVSSQDLDTVKRNKSVWSYRYYYRPE